MKLTTVKKRSSPSAGSALLTPVDAISPLKFFGLLVWLDGLPLLEVVEPYRRKILEDALYTFDADGRPHYNMVLAGRGKKNWKSADLCLAALYRFFAWPSSAGNDVFLVANDEDQAADDLEIVKKLIAANPMLNDECRVLGKQVERKNGEGTLQILPARDIAGSHGKTYLMVGFDEIHAYRNWDLIEALTPDPTRLDALVWITSYASMLTAPTAPLNRLCAAGRAGSDPRMYFSWYAGDYTTDSALQGAQPERRANPSMESWGNPDYLEQQRRRLPTHKYRRLHLNLPGAPEGAAFDAASVLACIAEGRVRVRYEPIESDRAAFLDMSGGSNDDAVLAIGRKQDSTVIVELVEKQSGTPPFNPRDAVRKFASLLKLYNLSRVTGDKYAGETFISDFRDLGIAYDVCSRPKSALYEALEPRINGQEVELLDLPVLQEQLLTLVHRGSKIDHQSGDHDDYANAVAGLVAELLGESEPAFAFVIGGMTSTPQEKRGVVTQDTVDAQDRRLSRFVPWGDY